MGAVTHGMFGTPEHIAWAQMIQRCYNPKHPAWPRYGGLGTYAPLGQQSKFMPSLDGSTFVPYGNWSSSRLSIAEMTELIELIYAWGAQRRFATDKGVTW